MAGKSKSYPRSEFMTSNIVTEVIKTVLYVRGQFPMPLEHIKEISKKLERSGAARRVDNSNLYCDPETDKQTLSVKTNRTHLFWNTEQRLLDTIMKFEKYFEELEILLQSGNVLEVVLSLGNSFMIPREVYHIKLPVKCNDKFCKWSRHSFDRCKRNILKELFQQNNQIGKAPPETIMPIDIMLLLQPDTKLTENVEYKNRYTIPKTCNPVVMHLNNFCPHNSGGDTSLSVHPDHRRDFPSHSGQSNLWVKVKTQIKGFSNKMLEIQS